MKVFTASLVVISVFSLASCSSLGLHLPSYDELLRTETGQDGRACIQQSRVRGYGTIEDDVISISSSGKKRYYLATTFLRCDSLLTSFKAGFKGDFFEFCGGRNDKIITPDETCQIKSVFEFDTREDAFATFDNVEKIRENLREEAKKQQEVKGKAES